jgi:nucleoside-diphosphate-sugar epimerase
MVSSSDQETVLVIGATGRHGGTGARVVERLQAAGRLVRALVHSDDDRAQALTATA